MLSPRNQRILEVEFLKKNMERSSIDKEKRVTIGCVYLLNVKGFI